MLRDPTENPYPGLRPFGYDDKDFFFGREGQADELLRRLWRSRFVAVVGESGCGKSSLVKAGLLPLLHSGLLSQAGSRWRHVDFRPGNDPIGRLAKKLNESFATHDGEDAEIRENMIRATLRRSGLGLANAVRDARLPKNENFLIVVDQFEELFRFKDAIDARMRALRNGAGERAYEDEASEFVKLLLGAVTQPDNRIYIVITMRSDFVGDCARFRGLPEAINRSEYLVPRLTRDQRELAIKGPARVQGVTVQNELVQRLLNDTGDDQDQLPILQHALMCTWRDAKPLARSPQVLKLADYDGVGGMEEALLRDANKALGDLSKSRKKVARKLFQCLTQRDLNNRIIRRPASVKEICGVTGADAKDVHVVINVFRQPGRSYLMPPYREPEFDETYADDLGSDELVDISHESLIRKWDDMNQWVVQEAKWAETYRELAKEAVKKKLDDKTDWLGEQKVKDAQAWKKEAKPTKAWADRYDDNFDLALEFLEGSADHIAKAKRFKRIALSAIGALVILIGGVSTLTVFQTQVARRATEGASATDVITSAAAMYDSSGTVAAGLAYLARALRLNDDNVAAKANVANALLYENWPLIVSQVSTQATATSVAFAPDGNRAVIATTRGAVVWNLSEIAGGQISVDDPDTFLIPHDSGAVNAFFSDDGSSLVTTSRDNFVRLWRVEAGDATLALEVPHDSTDPASELTAAALSRGGEWLATGGADGVVRIWNVAADSVEKEFAHDPTPDFGTVHSIEFSRGESLNVLTASADGTALLWASGQELPDTLGEVDSFEPIHEAAFSPDGRLVLTRQDVYAKLWDVSTGDSLGPSMGSDGVDLLSASFSADGRRVITASANSVIRVWSSIDFSTVPVVPVVGSPVDSNMVADSTAADIPVLPGQMISSFKVNRGKLTAARFAGDDTTIVTVSDSMVRVWSETNVLAVDPLTHDKELVDGRPRPNTTQVITLTGDGIATLWDVRRRSASALSLRAESGGDRYAVFHPSDRLLLTPTRQSLRAVVWDMDSLTSKIVEHPTEVRPPLDSAAMENPDWLWMAAFSPSGDQFVTVSGRGTAVIWNTDSLTVVCSERVHNRDIRTVAYADRGDLIVTASNDSTAKVWQGCADGGEIMLDSARTLRHAGIVRTASFSSNGKYVVTGSRDGTAVIWNLANGDSTRLQKNLEVRAAAFSDDGKLVATGANDSTARMWVVESGERVGADMRHAGNILSVDFDKDSRMVVTAGADGKARVWEAETGEPLSAWMTHQDGVNTAFFSPDGELVVTASDDNTVRVWASRTGIPVSQPFTTGAEVRSASFSHDGRIVAAASYDGSVTLIPVFSGGRGKTWRDLAQAVGGFYINDGGAVFPASITQRRATLKDLAKKFDGKCESAGDLDRFVCWFLSDVDERNELPAWRN